MTELESKKAAACKCSSKFRHENTYCWILVFNKVAIAG